MIDRAGPKKTYNQNEIYGAALISVVIDIHDMAIIFVDAVVMKDVISSPVSYSTFKKR